MSRCCRPRVPWRPSWRTVQGSSGPFFQQAATRQLSQDRAWSDLRPSFASLLCCGLLFPSESLADARVSPRCCSRSTCAMPSPLLLAYTSACLHRLPSQCSSRRWPRFESRLRNACRQVNALGETVQAPPKTVDWVLAATSRALRSLGEPGGCRSPLGSALAGLVSRSTCSS